MSIIIGIDHGYYAIKTAHCSFPAGLTSYGEHEPYTYIRIPTKNAGIIISQRPNSRLPNPAQRFAEVLSTGTAGGLEETV